MTDITDLIARVRELQAKANPPQTPGYVRVGEANLTEWAAVIDEIPALATECERLRERVARLEEALRDLDEFGHLTCIVDPACGCCTKCDARAALDQVERNSMTPRRSSPR